MSAGFWNRPTYVYTYWGHDFKLVYVGITVNPESRERQHARKPWWKLVAFKELSEPMTRTEALVDEGWHIGYYRPSQNRHPGQELSPLGHLCNRKPSGPREAWA